MDRYDEKKPGREADTIRRDDDEREHMKQGDVLGLSGTVPKAPDDPSTEYDEQSVAQRRERAAHAGDSGVADRTAQDRSKGATGIDMGAGGTGTDIKGE